MNKAIIYTSLRIVSQGDAYFEILEEFEYNNNKDILIKEQYYLDLFKDDIVNCRAPYRDEDTIYNGYGYGYGYGYEYSNENIGCITEKEFIHKNITDFWRKQNVKHNKWIEEYKKDINYLEYKKNKINRCYGSNSTSDNIIFAIEDVKNIEGNKKNECVNNCLKFIGFETNKNIKTIEILIKHIEDNKLPIFIISNIVKVKKLLGEKKSFNDDFKLNVGHLLKDCDYEINYLYKNLNNNNLFTFVYDSKKKYIDIIKNNEIIINDNIYITFTTKIFKKDRLNNNISTIYTPIEMYKALNKEIL